MTEENINDNDIISNSIDFLSERQNKRLEIIIEEKNSANKILQKKLKEILDYRAKFKSLEEEENLKEEELNIEESEKKKKII